MRLLFLSALSWQAGLAAYVVALRIIYGETISASDFVAVTAWSALAFAVSVPVAYLPVFLGLRRYLDLRRPALVLSLAGASLGAVPFAVINLAWGHGALRNFLTPEAYLFYCMFAASGAALGFGYSRR